MRYREEKGIEGGGIKEEESVEKIDKRESWREREREREGQMKEIGRGKPKGESERQKSEMG